MTPEDDDFLVERATATFRQKLRSCMAAARKAGLRPNVRLEAFIKGWTFDFFCGELVEHFEMASHDRPRTGT